MKRIIPKIALSFITGIILYMFSCTPESCFEETNAYIKGTMYLRETGKSVAPDSLTLYGLNMESNKIYDKSAGTTRPVMPLDASAASCTFIIKINGSTDTITFSYTSYPHLISKECGYTFYHNIDPPVYTKHIIDTVMLRKNNVTTLNEENIRIYY